MKKMLLGLTAVFALSVAAPAFAGEDGEKPAKAEKKGGKKGSKKDEKKDEGEKK